MGSSYVRSSFAVIIFSFFLLGIQSANAQIWHFPVRPVNVQTPPPTPTPTPTPPPHIAGPTAFPACQPHWNGPLGPPRDPGSTANLVAARNACTAQGALWDVYCKAISGNLLVGSCQYKGGNVQVVTCPPNGGAGTANVTCNCLCTTPQNIADNQSLYLAMADVTGTQALVSLALGASGGDIAGVTADICTDLVLESEQTE